MDYDADISYMLIRHMENCDAQATTEGSNARKGATENRHYQRSLTRLTYEAISNQNLDHLLDKQVLHSKRKLPVANPVLRKMFTILNELPDMVTASPYIAEHLSHLF
jgi:hypothetical protein